MSGRLLDAFRAVPLRLWRHLGSELGIDAPELASLRALYGRGRTLFDRQPVACEALGFRWMSEHQRRALVRRLGEEVSRCADRDQLLVCARHRVYEHRLLIVHDRAIRILIADAHGGGGVLPALLSASGDCHAALAGHGQAPRRPGLGHAARRVHPWRQNASGLNHRTRHGPYVECHDHRCGPGTGMSGAESGHVFVLCRSVRNDSVWIEHSLTFRGRQRLFIPAERWQAEAKRCYARLSLPLKATQYLKPLLVRVRAGVDAVAHAARSGVLRIDDELHLASMPVNDGDPEVTRLRATFGRRVADGLRRHPGPRHQPDGGRVRAHDAASLGHQHPPGQVLARFCSAARAIRSTRPRSNWASFFARRSCPTAPPTRPSAARCAACSTGAAVNALKRAACTKDE